VIRRAASLLLLMIAAACGKGEARPSVLLVTIDTLRADAVSAWGVEVGTTPVLDALADSGTRFANASSVTPITLPTHASILTGLRPAEHGLTVNGVSVSALPVATLAEQLVGEGYATGAFVSSTVLDRRFGLDAGFAHYDDDLVVPGGAAAPTERRGDLTVERALAWDGWSDAQFFAWVHLFDPHDPYEPKRPYDTLWFDPAVREEHHHEEEAVRAVIDDLDIPDQFLAVRTELESEPETSVLHRRLSELDPTAAARMEAGLDAAFLARLEAGR
jgi:arylsulfatase A-like enzyme